MATNEVMLALKFLISLAFPTFAEVALYATHLIISGSPQGCLKRTKSPFVGITSHPPGRASLCIPKAQGVLLLPSKSDGHRKAMPLLYSCSTDIKPSPFVPDIAQNYVQHLLTSSSLLSPRSKDLSLGMHSSSRRHVPFQMALPSES